MSVKITDNTPKIGLDTGAKVNLFLRFFMDEVDRLAEPITPKKEGELRRGTLKTVGGSTILRQGKMIWNKEYAAPQEAGTIKGHQITKYTTPGTGPSFALKSVTKAVAIQETVLRKVGLI